MLFLTFSVILDSILFHFLHLLPVSLLCLTLLLPYCQSEVRMATIIPATRYKYPHHLNKHINMSWHLDVHHAQRGNATGPEEKGTGAHRKTGNCLGTRKIGKALRKKDTKRRERKEQRQNNKSEHWRGERCQQLNMPPDHWHRAERFCRAILIVLLILDYMSLRTLKSSFCLFVCQSSPESTWLFSAAAVWYIQEIRWMICTALWDCIMATVNKPVVGPINAFNTQ